MIKVADTQINECNVLYWLGLFQNARRQVLEKLERFYDAKDNIGKVVEGKNRIDNQVHVGLAYMITKNSTDYFIGEPVSYSYAEGFAAQSYIDDLQFKNIEDAENKKIAKDCAKFGLAFELTNINEDKTIYYTRLDPLQTFIVWSAGILPQRLCTITYATIKPKRAAAYHEGYIYTDSEIIPFTMSYRKVVFGEPIDNVFKKNPVVYFQNNSDEIGDYERVTDLLTAYNKLMSCAVDDYESISNAILLIRDSQEIDEETKKGLNSTRVIQLFSENAEMAFINKTLDSSFVSTLRDALRQDILTVTNVPDFTDEKFAGGNNTSGIALRYKLIGFENLRADKEIYFKQALMRRWNVIGQYPANSFELKRDDIKIDMFPNLPNNVELDLEITKLYAAGAISRKTMLERMQTVKDANEEETRLDDEAADRIKKAKEYAKNTDIPTPDLKV